MKHPKLILLASALLLANSQASITIIMDYDLSNDIVSGIDNTVGDDVIDSANQAIFDNAATFWEETITGYADQADRILTVHVSAFQQAAVNNSILLGSAGPRFGVEVTAGVDNFFMATVGAARFNTHPDAVGLGGLLNELTIRHEVGHILGIGTLWDTTSTIPGTQDDYTFNSGEYTGANALAAFNNEFGKSATSVPVELDGGTGTANGHWNEGEASTTVVSGINAGESLDDALMTGNLSGSGYISDTTLGSLQDMGYTTIGFNFVPVPEPSSAILVAFGLGALTFRRKRS